MSDDVTRQRFWSWNNAKPSPGRRMPSIPRSRSSSRRSPVPAAKPTHALLVRNLDSREWCLVMDADRYVQGSEVFCQAERDTRSRHWPGQEFRVFSWPDAKREFRRKTWSVRDSDHIANGERVMLTKTADELHPAISRVHATFGMTSDHSGIRYGLVRSRYRRSRNYMVTIEGTNLTICVGRADIVYPVPDNVVALEPKRARMQRGGR